MERGASAGDAERTRLGKYDLIRPLAEGGMARLYLARTSGIGSFERHLVVKLILRDRAGDSNAVKMLLDEARLAATLNHHNVAQVYEVGEEGGLYYLAMEYVHGLDLRALLAQCLDRGAPLPLPFALTIAASAAAGLHHAHERKGANGRSLQIVHRDVSPSNLMVGYDGAVKLVDFGLAKAAQRSAETKTGIVKGKLAYLSPEQARGQPADRRSDVFSLGIVLYEITTMRRALRGRTDFETMQNVADGKIKRPSEWVPGYSPTLEAVVMKALTVDPAERYQTAAQVLAGIEQVAAEQRIALSNMALGHFMLEMFGEVPEPWLVPAAGPSPGSAEGTHSDVDAGDGDRSDGSTRQVGVREPSPAPPPPPAPRPSRRGVPIPAASMAPASTPMVGTIPPPSSSSSSSATPGTWSTREYPESMPAMASSKTLPPDADALARARAAMRHGYTTGPEPRLPSAPPVATRTNRWWIAVVIVVAALVGAAAAVLQESGVL